LAKEESSVSLWKIIGILLAKKEFEVFGKLFEFNIEHYSFQFFTDPIIFFYKDR